MPIMSRPKINGISVNVKNPDGTSETIDVKPDSWALFFHQDALKMLGTFYKNNPGKKFKRADMEKIFGKNVSDLVFKNTFAKKALKASQQATEIDLDEDSLQEIWDTPKASGFQTSYLTKTPPCIPEY
jgi:hypothetical protein